MKSVAENNVLPPGFYVVEIDGKFRSVCGIFIEALKAGMKLKQKFPHSPIKGHDVDETWAWGAATRANAPVFAAPFLERAVRHNQNDHDP